MKGPNETGINVNDVPIRDYLPDVITLPHYFKNHGYQAVGLGKVFHQGSGDSISWDYYWDGPPQRTWIPLLIHIPGKIATRTSSMTELIDLYPTLIEATGVGVQPRHLPGKSLMPLFDNPNVSLRPGAITMLKLKQDYDL